MRKSFSASTGVSEEVGSSMMITRAFMASALAISTSLHWPVVSRANGVVGLSSRPRRASRAAASRFMRARSSTAERQERLGAEEDVAGHIEVGGEHQLLVDEGDAARLGVGDALQATARRRCAVRPRRGHARRRGSSSASICPAPFSPTSESTSPAKSSIETPDSATTPGKRLVMPVMVSRGAGVVIEMGRSRGGARPRRAWSSTLRGGDGGLLGDGRNAQPSSGCGLVAGAGLLPGGVVYRLRAARRVMKSATVSLVTTSTPVSMIGSLGRAAAPLVHSWSRRTAER